MPAGNAAPAPAPRPAVPATPTAQPAAAAPLPSASQDWSNEAAAVTAKRAVDGDIPAQRYCHERAEAVCVYLDSEPFRAKLKNQLTASGLVAEPALEGRVNQFVNDAKYQFRDRRLASYYQCALCSHDSVEGAMLKFASSNISPNNGAEQGYFIPRAEKATGKMLAVATPGIKGQIDAIKAVFPPQQTGLYIDAVEVRKHDVFKVIGGTTPGILHERNIFFDSSPEGQAPAGTAFSKVAEEKAKLNPIIAAYAIVSLKDCTPVTVVYTTQEIERVNGQALGSNTYYAKTPGKEAANCVLRACLRKFIRNSAVAQGLANMENMLAEGYKVGEEPNQAAEPVETARQAHTNIRAAGPEPAITTTAARPGATTVPATGPVQPAPGSLRASVTAALNPSPTVVNPVDTALRNVRQAEVATHDSLESDVEGLGHDPDEGLHEQEQPTGGMRL